MSEDNATFTATIKAGPGYEAPWIVVRANTAAEMKDRLREAYSDLVGPLVATAQVYATEYGSFKGGGGNPGGQTFQGQGNGGFNGNTNPGNGEEHPTGAGNRHVETHPKGWGTFEHNHPDAPATMWGPKVLKRAKSQKGNDYAQWLDPRDPAIPSVTSRDKPSDYIEPEFAPKGI